MSECHLCPRGCAVDRKSNTGYCGQTQALRVARIGLHFWEEPCISGLNGSGAVFFSGCPLRCVYCQNASIALGTVGREISPAELVDSMFRLKEEGANNINLVTPTHFVPQLVPILEQAKSQGLDLPILYNTSAYETVETLRMLDGLVDIYLPDDKYADTALAKALSHAPDYPEVAMAAIEEMLRQVGAPVFEEQVQTLRAESVYGTEGAALGSTEVFPMIQRGVIVRHLVLPGYLENSRSVLRLLKERFDDVVYISIMNQYTPMRSFPAFPTLDRRVTDAEYDEIVDFAIEIGIENGFVQEGETASESFIPEFSGE